MTANEACFLLMTSLKVNKPKNVIILNMGKPVKIMEIIKKLISLKKKIDPNYIYEIKEIGLQQGEKMNEQLTISKKLIKTSNPDISISTDPTYSEAELDKLLDKLKKVNESKISTSLMKKFLFKDFRSK